MEFIWLASNSSDAIGPARHWTNVRAVNPGGHPATAFPQEGEATLIVEIADADDAERAISVVDDVRESVAVWIFDPHASVRSSIEWMKAGAAHVATSLDEIEQYMDSYPCTRAGRENHSPLVGRSQSIRNIDAEIAMVSNRRCNLLIEGETGTGKEVVARQTHAASDRSRGPWVPVNCGAIPEALLEAELFGHVKGAFTGAVQPRAGKFEAANHGTIFLDEIGDMPLAVQAKLLRVLQEREVERLGGNERIRLDVRVIAATNANLAERVRAGLFRQDLYYRLNVFRIVMPPLRERAEDIPVLAQHFVEKVCTNERIARKSLDRTALDRLRAHSWPGNVRELENVIESAVIVSGYRAVIFASDLRLNRPVAAPAAASERATSMPLPAEGLDYQTALEEFEKNLLTQALARTRGNKTAAADLLGLKRTTLAAKMRILETRLPRLVA
jgi:transcriptional regulator with PAS, ATPase and Fis domain